jgi:hypothetical protein
MTTYYYIYANYSGPGGGFFTINSNDNCSYGFDFYSLAKFATIQEAEEHKATLLEPEAWHIRTMES